MVIVVVQVSSEENVHEGHGGGFIYLFLACTYVRVDGGRRTAFCVGDWRRSRGRSTPRPSWALRPSHSLAVPPIVSIHVDSRPPSQWRGPVQDIDSKDQVSPRTG